MDFTPASPSESVRLAKQNMTDQFSVSGWAVLDQKRKGTDSNSTSSWANVLTVLEIPTIMKISQKQYTFFVHLIDELGLFLDVLERNKVQSRLIKQQKSSSNDSSNDVKFTVCLYSPTTFTLAVIDGLEDASTNLAAPIPPPVLPEAELEPTLRDKSESNVIIDLVATSAPLVAGTAKLEPSSTPAINIIEERNSSAENLNKGYNLLSQQKSKLEGNIQRGLEIASNSSLESSQTSLTNLGDSVDDTLSQYDQLSDDLDAAFDPNLLNIEYEQKQEKAARIELDEDSVSLADRSNTDKMVIGTNALESVCELFHRIFDH